MTWHVPSPPAPTLPPIVSASSPHWVLDEDDALKDKLGGFYVINPADGAQKPVQTFFANPDAEEISRAFPRFVIELISIEFARERAHRSASVVIPFDLEQATPPSGFSMTSGDFPLPWNLIYQVSAYSRNPRHDRQLSLIMFQLFPEQFGDLNMQNYDGTTRRADLVSHTHRDIVDNDQKRTYRQIFEISVSSEFYLNQIQYIQQVSQVDVQFVDYLDEPIIVPTGV